MPTKTYTGIDLQNYTVTDLLGFTIQGPISSASISATPSSQAIVSINGTGSAPNGGSLSSTSAALNGTYQIDGVFDFDAFPEIPANALITQIEVKINSSISSDVSVFATTLYSYTIGGKISIGNAAFGEFTDLTCEAGYQVFGDNSGGGTFGTDSISDTVAPPTSQIFDFTGAPLTKAALIANWSDIVILMRPSPDSFPFHSYVELNADIVATGTINVNETLNNFQFDVTYVEGPVEYTLTPPGGDAEQGQTITVNGLGAAGQSYAALIDNKVVPIIPKIISDDEVTLEIPNFPTQPCFDCFGDCPNCDACLDACAEDLTGEDCQACMQACLDCLTSCLEDLQLAEECQQSTGSDAPPTAIIIIMGTQFSGSVPLGEFEILVADASGIYTFVEGKTNDTLYTAERDGETYNVKIPNPGARTGFFRS